MLVTAALLGLFAGAFIGAIGVGGILLVSGLIYLAGLSPPLAIAACMLGYLLTGLIGTAVFARAGSIRWPMAAWLAAGAMPTAYAGAWTTSIASPALLELGVGLLTAGAGLQSLLGRHREIAGSRSLNPIPLALIGAVVGFGSAVTGTGGPLLLVPILLWLKIPVLTAIGLSQAIQIPIATLATLGNLRFGAIDWQLGAVLAGALSLGSWVGAKSAHAVPQQALKRLVSVVLLIIGLLILLSVTHRAGFAGA
jgi:hypothetical protein